MEIRDALLQGLDRARLRHRQLDLHTGMVVDERDESYVLPSRACDWGGERGGFSLSIRLAMDLNARCSDGRSGLKLRSFSSVALHRSMNSIRLRSVGQVWAKERPASDCCIS